MFYVCAFYNLLPSPRKPHYDLFPKMLYLQNIHQGVFLFHLWISNIYLGANFLIRGTSSNRMEPGPRSTEDEVERPNQSVIISA